MSLRFALLTLLRVGPLSGYDLKKQFSMSVGYVWHAPDSQIYPELKRMARDGLLEPEDVPRGPKGTRTIYHVTDEGEAAFLDWFEQMPTYQRQRDPASLRAAYLESATAQQQTAFFETHRAHWQGELDRDSAELERLKARTSPALLRRLEHLAPGERDAAVAWKVFAYEGLVARAEWELQWAQRGLDLVGRLEANPASV
ncbi:MAG: PadR family transcriptional regulator [Galactobacter sp.]|uniref:PadR family transcriptional regulator n=1 Tax=Galactobacter sp. TaxID=2676125 RepID=UPI0025BA14F3|nr:PadR family transcriptional regulator [Galactobacter sp.]